jgi:hypothetical protein
MRGITMVTYRRQLKSQDIVEMKEEKIGVVPSVGRS